ncbi:hypothetical protein G7Z12_37705 [Streptomyces sp. ID38640]|uniref:hypothetical protein n=1 Tax=Streptomyces sp. ID38640 TaxID=1265399 RepID=UPI00140EBEA5|nr:hypothetical protein [Streptomyces sp. ID38640]QIK04712.1 hypothetical protein G7Z12_00035 [Streptomyces sp. ID38640]QIK10877.1 hypothetical protein G7Z12_37330 [Streptomyces sp. ID38640]QIK10934.1 hypothetical protein G7Z12_37705 [Streptomyces sp. ID38640]
MTGKAGVLKGDLLERRFARAEFAEGSLVRVRHPVTHLVAGRTRTVTDVDVLSIDFDARLRPHIGISECKSTRGQSGEQDRLLWLKGLQTLVAADRATLVRETVTEAGRYVARRIDVDLIGTAELTRREQVLQHLPEHFGVIGDTPFKEQSTDADRQLKKIGDLPSGLVAFLRHDALLAAPHRTLGALITLDEIMRAGTVLPAPLAPLLAGHALQALIAAALRAGGRTDTVGSDGTRQEIEHGLGTGDPHDRQLLRVAEMADTLLRQELAALHQAYRSSGASAIERSVPSVRSAISQTPAWLATFMDLSERLRRRSPIARHLPQTIDLAVFDALVGGDSWQAPAFDHLFSLEHRQALTIAVTCVDRAVPALAPYLAPVLDLPFNRTRTSALGKEEAASALNDAPHSPADG